MTINNGDLSIRHGDLGFEKINALPKGVKKINNPVLAEGEVTGHAHRLESLDNVDVYVDEKGEIFLEVKTGKSVGLTHEEHNRVEFSEGIYHMIRQQEMTPEGWRQVAD